jgi:hypothetical protein
MFKRRLAIVGTVAVLGLTGMAGAAMADPGTAGPGTVVVDDGQVGPVQLGDRQDFRGKLKCWKGRGGKSIKSVEFSGREVVELAKVEPELAEVVTGADDETISTDAFTISVPARSLPVRVVHKRERGHIMRLSCSWKGAKRWVR